MNWEAINAVSQLVSSIAVVLSVLYLGIQVHRSTRVAKLATQDAAATALRDVTKPFMENAELERIWRVGLEDLSALSSEDRARFFHATYQFLKAFETIHFHYVLWPNGRAALGRLARTSSTLRSCARNRPLLETSSRSFLRAVPEIR
jgi:ABC-type multidrug transport system fused ATPase/permease subunit